MLKFAYFCSMWKNIGSMFSEIRYGIVIYSAKANSNLEPRAEQIGINVV